MAPDDDGSRFRSVHSNADVEIRNGLPYPESNDAFLHSQSHLCSVVRSLRPGMAVAIDLIPHALEVVDIEWAPQRCRGYDEVSADNVWSIADEPAQDPPKADEPRASVEYTESSRDCGFDHIYGLDCWVALEGETTFYVVDAPADDLRAPVVREFPNEEVGETVPATPLAGLIDDFSTSCRYAASRIARVPPSQIEADPEATASAALHLEKELSAYPTRDHEADYCASDGSERAQTNLTSLAGVDDPGTSGRAIRPSRSSVQRPPDNQPSIGKCPACTGDVVEDPKRDRVVCTSCRKWCQTAEWNQYGALDHSDDGAAVDQ